MREEIDLTISTAAEHGSVPQNLADQLRSAESADAVRASLVELWEPGLRDYVLQTHARSDERPAS
jgi:hypothetical protein